jgi:aspartate/methionine/tyrosine aminotransferase
VIANLAELDTQLSRVPEICRLVVEGGWYATLRIPALAPDGQTVLALLERGVWVQPGYFFGMPESGWLVVSLLATAEEFRNGVTALINYFETNRDGNSTRPPV